MNKGTALVLGFLAGILLADKVKRFTGIGTPTAVPRIPAKTKAPYAATRAISGVSWDCTQQDWLQKNIIRYNNPFGG